MTIVAPAKAPGWFMPAASAGLLWELFGIYSYLMHVGVFPQMEMDDSARSLMESNPPFVTALFAIAVFSGAIGTLGLVLRRAWARPVLIVSLLAVVLQFGSWLTLTDAVAVIGPSVFAMPAVIVLAGVLLVWLATLAGRRGWLS
jgi:hypothetical protein